MDSEYLLRADDLKTWYGMVSIEDNDNMQNILDKIEDWLTKRKQTFNSKVAIYT